MMATAPAATARLAQGGSFEELWPTVQVPVARYCRRSMWSSTDADDLMERVMVRAWQGHATFRAEASYLTWVMSIAAREAARLHAQLSRRRQRESDLDHGRVDPHAATATPAGPGAGTGWLRDAVTAAADAGAITATEAAVVALRLAGPTTSWEEIGAQLGLTRAACAVVHCRAVPKLRVHLFLHHEAELGGRDAVAEAFAQVRDRPVDPLGPAEAAVFQAVVLDRRAGYRRRGWQADLRAACGAVIRRLDAPATGT